MQLFSANAFRVGVNVVRVEVDLEVLRDERIGVEFADTTVGTDDRITGPDARARRDVRP
ncbi:hypothetical protein D3C86_2044330 [compost metagenome]